MSAPLKVATFTLQADSGQAKQWKQAAKGEGFPTIEAWAAMALDSYLQLRAMADRPVVLSWSRSPFTATLRGQTYQLTGHVSYPFASFMGTVDQPDTYHGTRKFVLVYLPTSRVLATLTSFSKVRILASELAKAWVTWEGPGEPPGKPPQEAVDAALRTA